MKLIAPDYYRDFACLAGACRHSCCVGWEIDVDEESLARYRAVQGAMGERLRGSIEETAEGAHFRMSGDERCPFLNADGLCDMILELGEDSLCQICADHPRFRSFFADRTEIGLGLCCEAAGRLILLREKPSELTVLSDDGGAEASDPYEEELLALRDGLTAAVQDRSVPVAERVAALAPEGFRWHEWIPFLLTLERLDDAWADALNLPVPPEPLPEPAFLEIALEQLAVCLLYRHLPGALEDGDERGRVAYAALVVQLIRRLCQARIARYGALTPDDIVELCRLYSSELEYSDENLCAILDRIAEG